MKNRGKTSFDTVLSRKSEVPVTDKEKNSIPGDFEKMSKIKTATQIFTLKVHIWEKSTVCTHT